MTRQIFRDLEANEIMKRIEPFGAAPLGELRRRPEEVLLIPILQLAQTDTDNPACRLSVVSGQIL